MAGKFINLLGQTIGNWTVIDGPFRPKKRTYWLCRCKCGKEKSICAGFLRQSRHHFGCRSCANTIHGRAPENYLFAGYKRGATVRGYEWLITKDQFYKLIHQPCYYCGKRPEESPVTFSCWKKRKSIPYNGLDRKDNNKGYFLGNIVTACKICNLAKHNQTQEAFENWIRRVISWNTHKTTYNSSYESFG